jgi:FkbM family methyltransferase
MQNPFTQLMKTLIKQFLPPILWDGMHKLKIALLPTPKEVKVKAGCHQLTVPAGHRLHIEADVQPYRNLAIGVIAKYVGEKFHGRCMVDIGANVGDTGAMMASYCTNTLVLVDPSDTYFGYMQRNTSLFSNPVELVKGIVAGDGSVRGTLLHERGTARIQTGGPDAIGFKQFRLSELGDGNACFVKIDTDGFDYEIIQSSGDFLQHVHPVVYWEGEVNNREELSRAVATVRFLQDLGYAQFAVYDDPGFFLLSTNDISVIEQLHNYLFEVGKHSYRRSIFNYNIAAFHETDSDVADRVIGHFQRINKM